MTTKPTHPEILELDANLVAEIQQRIAARQLSEQDYEVFAATLATPWYLANLLTQKNISIGRLKQLVFGASTEKTESVIGRAAEAATSPPAGEGDPSAASPSCPAPDAPPKRRKGQGRNGADDYPGAEKIPLPHESLQPGDSCPECGQGKLSEQPRPAVLIRFTGQAPVHAKIYQRQRLRCNLCGKVFTAQAPEGVGADKYDVTVASTIGLLKYGTGMPFYRLAGLQESVGIPLPASTQWKKLHGFSLLRRAD